MAISDDVVEVNQAQIEHRAAWMGLIYDEMKKAGIDAETIIRRAVKRCGHITGENIKKRCADPGNFTDFKKAFLSEATEKTLKIEFLEVSPDKLSADFHNCPLITSWKKLGFDDKTCELLCDIAMDGDRGIAEVMGYTFELGGTIAEGCPTCKLQFHK